MNIDVTELSKIDINRFAAGFYINLVHYNCYLFLQAGLLRGG